MQVRTLVDWLRFTSVKNITEELLSEFGLMVTECRPNGFYNAGITLHSATGPCGCVEWHTEHPGQRVCYTFTGKDLDVWRARDKLEALVHFARDHNARFTRIDVAIDLLDCGGQVEDVARCIEGQGASLPVKTHSIIRGVHGGITGTTVYIGSRQSDRFTRIYDKGAEQGLPLDWIRLELECKGDFAIAIGADDRIFTPGGVIAEITRRLQLPGVQWFSELLTHSAEREPLPVNRTRGNRLRWQDNVLFGMCLDAIEENEDFAARIVVYLKKSGVIDRYSE